MIMFSSTTEAKIQRARASGNISATEYQVPYANIGALLNAQVERSPEKVWMIFYPDDSDRRAITYLQFHDLVQRSAALLHAHGIRRGDRIATVAYNHIDTVVQYFAAWNIGAVVVPINVGEDDERIGYMLQNSETKLAFVREEFVDRFENILAESAHACTIIRGGEYPMQNWNPQLVEVSLEDEALIVYTSGTTGQPKGVVLSHYNLLIDARAIAEWHGITNEQRMMCVLPIHHVNGTVVTLMTPLYAGGSVVLNQRFQSHIFFERLAFEGVHVVSVVPTLLQFLLHQNPDVSEYDLTQFRHLICGAGPLTCELAEKFEKHFGMQIIHGYGLSETTCYSCFLPLDLSPDQHRHWLQDFGFPSIGVPILPNEMAIHDDAGIELSEESRGEIVIRGHNVMKGYFANPAANEQVFSHGWFRSGDEGFFKTDEKGRKFFFITGRIKELIIRGGVNISPFEIDKVLMNMPGANAGLAVGFDNDWYGEEVGAYVHPVAGTSLTEVDVIAYCRKHLPFAKCPKVVVFGNDMPVTSTGKYQRNKLKPLFEKWKGVQFKGDDPYRRPRLTAHLKDCSFPPDI